jgi:hypothetical protein
LKVKLRTKRTRPAGIALFLLCSAISLLWGIALARTANGGSSGFQAIYYGTRCLLQHHDPYRQSELEAVYRSEGGEPPSQSFQTHQAVTLYVNLPTTFILVAPLAMLPWSAAHALWLALLAGAFFLAAFLIWNLRAGHGPNVSLFLVCVLIANAEVIFGGGNTAGIVVSLCVLAVWCFLNERFVPAGILCLAVSLAIKPHDVGLVWLYFLLAGGVHRKRALQVLLITGVLGLSAFLWVSHVAPHWIEDWRSNLSAISSPGGINQPGPTSVGGSTPDMVIDLQAAVSVFKDDPRIYNLVSYLVCVPILLVWAIRTLRSRFTQTRAWLALAAIVPLTMLITYHRPYDAKLLLLTIPACAILWAQGGALGRTALLISTAGILFTSDIPLAIFVIIADKLQMSTAGFFGQIVTVVLTRPASLVLLLMAIFYMSTYVRQTASD